MLDPARDGAVLFAVLDNAPGSQALRDGGPYHGEPVMTSRTEHEQPKLPGNHGQFGGEVATEAFTRMRATQRVRVKPVVPRQSAASQTARARLTKDLPPKPM